MVNAVVDERREYLCCGRVLWQEVVSERDGELVTYLLLPNDMLATEFHGACLRCGQEHHWSQPAVRLRKLLARMRR